MCNAWKLRHCNHKGQLRPFAAFVVIAVLLVSVFSACGYHFAGSGQLPDGVHTIGVRMLTNRTAESGLETEVTNALIDELTRRRQDLVVDVDHADAVLSGTIDSLATETLSRSGLLTATERRLVITASLVLKDRQGEILWQRSRLSAEQAYAVTNDAAQSERNRQRAIVDAARRLAEYTYERLTDTF